ncbi:MAG: hypothetical protein FJ272_00930, partial [Planctomycetes bacterium]|nr:hypothetical protein [Planctomycetota bacterium]
MTHIRLSFAPGWSYPVILLVTVAALASVYWFYQRVVGAVPRKQLQTLLILRVVAMTVLLLCLFRPVLSFQKTLSKKTGLLML